MKEFFKNLKFAWIYTKDQKWKLFFLFFVNILLIIVSILMPIYYAKVLVEITNNEFYRLFVVALVSLILECLRNILNYFSDLIAQTIYKDSFTKIQIELGRETLKLENKVMESNGSGVFIQRINSDASNLSDIFYSIFAYIANVLSYIGKYIGILIISPIIFIYLVICTIILTIIEKIRAKRVNEKDKIVRKKNESKSGFIAELVRGSKDIKMLNAENSFINEFKSKIKDSNEEVYTMQRTRRHFRLFSSIANSLFDFILILLMIFLLINEYLIPVNALIIWNYSGGLLYSISYFGNLIDIIKNFNLSANRVFEIIKGKEFSKETFGDKHLNHVNGDFEFKNVTFKYDTNKVLNKINFKIKANETVAFVGKSGAGKTTIFNLLCKMYEPNTGTIRVDGVNIKKLDKDTIRGNITIISQNPYIFNMTIRDNLRLVKEDLTESEMINACKLACLHDFIMKEPKGYDTMIGEGGLNLSGGQKQRLAIARAFVQKTEIILFDEATSALDNETQAKIQKAISNMKGEYTILIIAHRLSTIINADRILFINDGKVEAEGSHKELLSTCENYKHLYESEIKHRK